MTFKAKISFTALFVVLAACGVVHSLIAERISLLDLASTVGGVLGMVYTLISIVGDLPYRRTYKHEHWIFDAQGVAFPYLIILAKEHKKGAGAELEFRQGDLVFPWTRDDQGNITITRDNHSIGQFANLRVIIRAKS